MDSGASHHMVGRISITPEEHHTICLTDKTGANEVVDVTHEANVCVKEDATQSGA